MPATGLLVGGPDVRARSETKHFVFTLAEVNAGPIVLVPGAFKYTLRVRDVQFKTDGLWATGTSLNVQSTASSPVNAAIIPVASMTDGNVLDGADIHAAAGGTFDPEAAIGIGDGIQLAKVGPDFTGGNSIQISVTTELIDGPGVHF